MSAQLIYINLSIDSLWDNDSILRKICPIEVPLLDLLIKSNQALGLFLSQNPNDLILTEYPIEKSYIEYLDQFNITTPHFFSLSEDRRHKTLQEKITQFKPQIGLFAGLSSFEEQLLSLLPPSPQLPIDLKTYRHLNSKECLFNLTRELEIPFPESLIGTLEEIEKNFLPHFSEILLKAIYSSGGTGKFTLNTESDTTIQYLKKRTPQGLHWLAQEKFKRLSDFTFMNSFYNPQEPKGYLVTYDKNGYSFLHQPLSETDEIFKQTLSTFSKIQNHLLKFNYEGPWGIDGFITENGTLYPAIDLNVRFNKTHLIEAASHKFSIADKKFISYRHRFIGSSDLSFSSWWTQICETLNLNSKGFNAQGDFFIPYHTFNIKTPVTLQNSEPHRPIEWVAFIGTEPDHNLNSWLEFVQKKLNLPPFHIQSL